MKRGKTSEKQCILSLREKKKRKIVAGRSPDGSELEK